jgi:hypothetical protein
MDDSDYNELIQIAAEDKTRMVTLDLEAGLPVAATIKSIYNPPKAKIEITPAQQSALNSAWQDRKIALRRMKDNDDPRKLQELKKGYFQSIESYKLLYKRVYGE